MDDLERWLQATMRAVEQEPPAGLLSGIWRRRRRHLTRAWAGFAVAAVVATAVVPLAVHGASRGAPGGGSGQPSASGGSRSAPPQPGAAPGTKLLTCPMYSDVAITGGELSAHWQRSSVKAGPIWLVYARNGSAWVASRHQAGGTLRNVGGVIVAVPNGSTVELTTPPADRSRLKFLTRAAASGRYTLSDGVTGLTFVACPVGPAGSDIPDAMAPGLTLFYLPLGYITDLTGCLPFEVATAPSWRADWAGQLSVKGGTCRS